MKAGIDFKYGYSPERINPGEKVHTLPNTIKIVSGCDSEALDVVAKVYELVVKPGVHRAPNVKVAEAAKIIENTQRDVNIALMNELSIIFSRIGINTYDVLEAAGTKWNFLKFYPGFGRRALHRRRPLLFGSESQRVEISLPDNQCGPLYKRQYGRIYR